jgi:hypothetical protein
LLSHFPLIYIYALIVTYDGFLVYATLGLHVVIQGRFPAGQASILIGLAATLMHILLYHLFII